MKLFPALFHSAMAHVTPMTLAIGISAVLHAGLLTVRFVDPEGFNRIFEETPLEVILVNAKSGEKPVKAQAIAQSDLAGGGEADDEKARARTPLPPSAMESIGNELENARQQIDSMQQEQMSLLTQVRQQIATLPVPDPDHPASTAEEIAQEEKRQQLIKILGEIDRRIQEENARPRKRYISPATMKGVQALYYDTLKNRIEDKGTTNFPEQAGQKLYGELILMMTVNHDGRVLETQVMQSSGNRTLDRRAEAIAVSAGPFDKFDTELRKFTDQLVIVSRFKFARNNTLEAQFTTSANAPEVQQQQAPAAAGAAPATAPARP